jgi:hypothetical protein
VLAERDGESARVRHLTQRLEAVEREHALERSARTISARRCRRRWRRRRSRTSRR